MLRWWMLGLAVCACGSNVVTTAAGGGASEGGGGTEAASGGATTEMVCAPRAVEACYGGPDTTVGVGVCRSGERRCLEDGSGFGACEGEVLPSVEDCATLSDEDCDGQSPPCAGAPLWSVHLASPVRVEAMALAVGATGDVVVVGNAGYDLDVDGTLLPGDPLGESGDPFVLRFDSQGALLQGALFVSPGQSQTMAVAVDPLGDVLFGGFFQGTLSLGGPDLTAIGISDLYLAKLSAGGSDLWSQHYGGPSPASGSVRAIAADALGDVVAFGDFRKSIDFDGVTFTNTDERDLIVMKRDTTGALVLAKQIGAGLGQEEANDLALDAAGNMYLTGRFYGAVDFGGGVLAAQGFGSGYLAKLDPLGNHLFSLRMTSSQNVSPKAVSVDARGAVYVVGHAAAHVNFGAGPVAPAVEGNADVFVAKYDAQGALAWVRRFGGALTNAWPSSVAASSYGVSLCGYFSNDIAFGGDVLQSLDAYDGFLVQLSLVDGTPSWSRRFGGDEDQGCRDLAALPDGRIAMVGDFTGTIGFGTDVYTATDVDGFVAVFAP